MRCVSHESELFFFWSSRADASLISKINNQLESIFVSANRDDVLPIAH